MENSSFEKSNYNTEQIISFLLDLESIKHILPKIFNPETANTEIKDIYNQYPPSFISHLDINDDMNLRIKEKIKSYIKKFKKITSQEELRHFHTALYSQLVHKFIFKSNNPNLQNIFLQVKKVDFGFGEEDAFTPKSYSEIDQTEQDLFLNFVKKISQNEMFDLFHSYSIFFYTDIFVNTKYEEDKFISILEQEFIKSQLLFFNKIFGKLNEEQKRRLPTLKISRERFILQQHTNLDR